MSTSQDDLTVKNNTDSSNIEPSSPIFTKVGVKRGRPQGSNSSTPGNKKVPREDDSGEESEPEREVVTTCDIKPAQTGTMPKVLHDRPQNTGKPFRDWEGAHAPTKELNKQARCAAYEYTIDTLTNKLGNFEIARNHPEQLHKHLLEWEFCVTLRTMINDKLSESLIHNLVETNDPPETDSFILNKIRNAALQLANKDLVENKKKFESQAPASETQVATDIQVICEGLCTALVSKLGSLITNAVAKFNPVHFADKSIPESIIKLSNPFLTEIGDVVSYAVEQAAKEAPSRGAVRLQIIKDAKEADKTLRDNYIAKQSITALQVQTAKLTSAVAETYSKEDETKLRLRNLEGVVKTKAVLTGDAGHRRVNKEKRENELIDWIKTTVTKHNKIVGSFQLFIIDPRGESRQKTSAILTVSLPDDKFKLEQCIAAERKVDRTNPSSQRYTGPDHLALNIPTFKDVSSTILGHYIRALDRHLSTLSTEARDECRNQWSVDTANTSLYITKKNLKSPFKLFFEFTDPSNNLTLMRYFPGQNPFNLFDFAETIPNPATREKARTDELYRKRYNPYNNRK